MHDGYVLSSSRSQTWKIVITIIKCFIGSGVLFLPKAFSNGGYLFSSVSFVVCAYITNVCVTKLIACRNAMPPGSDYGSIGFRVTEGLGKGYGRLGSALVNTSLVLSQCGFCCVYISFVARNVIQLLNSGPKGCWVGPDSLWILILCEFFILAPLTWIRRLSSFATTNLVANALIGSGIVAILAYSISGMASAPGPRGGALHLPTIGSRWPLMVGTAVYAFEGAGMVVPMVNELPPGDRRKFPYVFAATLAGVSLLYILVGLIPYVFLEGFSSSTDCTAGAASCVQDTITLNLPKTWWSYGVVGGYCIALLFSYPLMMFPAMKVMEDGALPFLFPSAAAAAAALARSGELKEGTEEDGSEVGMKEEEEEGIDEDGVKQSLLVPDNIQSALDTVMQAKGATGWWRRNAFRSGIVAVTLLIAYLGAPQLDNMVALIGAFCCTPIAFIFPACSFYS